MRHHEDDTSEDDGLLERLFGTPAEVRPTVRADDRPRPRPLPRPRPRPPDARRSWPRLGSVAPSAAVVPALAVAVVAVLALVYVLVAPRDDADPTPRTASPAERLGFPAAVPAGTEYVRSRVLDSGEIEVDHWIASRRPMSLVVAPPPEAPADTDVRAADVQVETPEGARQGAGIVETHPRTYFVGGAEQVHVSYVLTGAVVRRGGPGRVLARPTSLNLDYPGDRLPRVVELVGGRVLAAACSAGDATGPRPCGQREGRSWRVRLEPLARDDVVTARVDLRPGR